MLLVVIVSIVTVVMVADISTTLCVLVTVVVNVVVDGFNEFVDFSINFNDELNGGILVGNAAVLVG